LTRLRVLLSRVLEPLLGRRRERELTEEIQVHLDLLTEEHLRRGLSAEAARAAASRDFGGVERVKEAHRDQRSLPFIDTFHNDLRFAVRLLAKDRWLSSLAAAALALGIGASNTVFTFVNAAQLRGLPVDEPEGVLAIHRMDASGRPGEVSYAELEALRVRVRALEGIAGSRRSASTVTDEGLVPEQIRSLYVTSNAFRLLRVEPFLGRDFLPQDDRPGATPVVILGESVFRNRYASDRKVLDSTIRVNGVETNVIGVMPEGFRFDYFAELWQPLAAMPGLTTDEREAPQLRAFGRLADGFEISEARAEIEGIDEGRRREGSESDRQSRLTAAPFNGTLWGNPIMPALLGSVGFLLLIACANVANLLLARGTHRAREIGIRTAIGATRYRILRQLVVESAILAGLAGVIGFCLSLLGVRLFSSAVSDIAKPYWIHFSMDGRVFLFFASVCVATGILFGLAPALHLSKTTTVSLKSVAATGARRWTVWLLTAELALTLALLAGAGLMLRSFLALYRLDNVVDTTDMTTMALRLPNAKYQEPRDWTAFFRSLEERLAGIPSLSAATTASAFPYAGAAARQLVLEGPDRSPRTVSYLTVGSRYFETLGLRLVRGRNFTDVDGSTGHEAAIVNEILAGAQFPNEDPLGKRIGLTDDKGAPSWFTIVGVAPDVRQRSVAGPDPTVYLPSRADPQPFAVLLVRGAPGTDAVVPIVREEVLALDPELPLYGIMEMDQLLSQSRWPHRVFGVMLAVFASIALALSAVGLYAVVAHSVSQRFQEIGIRMAFGAEARQVSWLVTRSTARPLVVGLAIGLAAAFGVGKLLGSLLVRTSPTDPMTLLAIIVLLLVVSAAACWLPARRAARLDLVSALRHE
jgi:putative ABC transport system permease protein